MPLVMLLVERGRLLNIGRIQHLVELGLTVGKIGDVVRLWDLGFRVWDLVELGQTVRKISAVAHVSGFRASQGSGFAYYHFQVIRGL